MGKKKDLSQTKYNPIESQLAADVAGPTPAVEQETPAQKPRRRTPSVKAAPARVAPAVEKSPPDREKAPVAPRAAAVSPQREVVKKVRLEEQAWLDFDDLLRDIRAETGTQLPVSIVTRACWGLMVQARAELLAEMKDNPLGGLPSTKDPVAFAAFEDRVRNALATAYRKLPRTL